MPKPVLRHIANVWTMWGYPTEASEWSLEQKLRDAKAAGFDGFTVQANAEHRRLADKLGLSIVGYFSSGKAAEFKALAESQQAAGVKYVNVQLADEDTLTPEAIGLAIRLNQEGNAAGLKIAVEVHRDTCTETPEKTYALADAYQKVTGELLELTWDFSHIAVVKHLAPPFYERLLVRPDLIQRAQQFHFRPFNGHHCQVPVTDGRGNLTQEVRDWLPFVEKTMAMWLAGQQDGREMFVVPEMGPVSGGYNLSTLPNGWEEAKVLRGLLQQAWDKVTR